MALSFYSDYVPVHEEDGAGGGHALRRHHYGRAGAGGQAAPRTLSTRLYIFFLSRIWIFQSRIRIHYGELTNFKQNNCY